MQDPIEYPNSFQKKINEEDDKYKVVDYVGVEGTPAITFITRHMLLRPKCIHKNIASVKKQSSQSYQHIFIIDSNTNPLVKTGMLWANSQIPKCRERVFGEFVMVLDDDGMLVDPDFVSMVEEEVSKPTQMIIIRSQHRKRVYPSDKCWNTGRLPLHGIIDSPSTIVRREMYLRFADHYSQEKGGDYRFILACFKHELAKPNPQIRWIDKVIAYTGALHKGSPEGSKCFL